MTRIARLLLFSIILLSPVRSSRRSRSQRFALGAMGTIVAYAAAAGTVQASTSPRWLASLETAPTAVSMQQVFDLDIAPELLDVVIDQFEAATGIELELALGGIAQLPSPGVRGTYSPDQALEILLSGTGVTFRFTSGNAAVLELSASEEIAITAALPPAEPSSVKYTEPLRDIPQTITVISSALIEEQGATTLRDVLANVSGVTMAAGEGGQPAGDNLTVRGFSARSDITIDGVRDLGTQSRDAFNLEQVEVIKGPASAYSGRGSPGGTINLVSKTPSLQRDLGSTVMLGNAGMKRVTTDFNTPVPALGEGAGFRLNLMSHDAGVPGRDVVRNKKWGAAPSLAFGLNSNTRFTLSYSYLDQDNISDYGIPWVRSSHELLVEHHDRPAPVPRNTFYGFRDRDYERLTANTGTVLIEHDLSERVGITQQTRYGRSSRGSLATPPRFAGNDTTDINRELRSWRTEDDIWSSQTNLRAVFDTGSVQHAVVTGMDLSHEANVRQNGRASNIRTTLLNPDPHWANTEPVSWGGIGDVAGNTVALYAFDTMSLGPQWDVTSGFRWERFGVEGVSTRDEHLDRVDTMPSPRVAVAYKPRNNGSFYVSYGTSLNPTLEGLAYSAGGRSGTPDIEPEKTYHAGDGQQVGAGRGPSASQRFTVPRREDQRADAGDPARRSASGSARTSARFGRRVGRDRQHQPGVVALRGLHVPRRPDPGIQPRLRGRQPHPECSEALRQPLDRASDAASERGGRASLRRGTLRKHLEPAPGGSLLDGRSDGLVSDPPERGSPPQRLQPDRHLLLRPAGWRTCGSRSRACSRVEHGARLLSRCDFDLRGEYTMLLHVPGVLNPEQVADFRATLKDAEWSDGRSTAGHQSVRVKHNLQLPENAPAARRMGDEIVKALQTNSLFMAAAVPLKVFPPLFNRYEGGGNFGTHIDNAIRTAAGTAHRIRTDLSATLFLSEPADYDGGELNVEDTYGVHSVKLPAGDLVLYPA